MYKVAQHYSGDITKQELHGVATPEGVTKEHLEEILVRFFHSKFISR